MQVMGGNIDIIDVARKAVQKCATQKVIHKDLEWRHIALLPVFTDDSSAVLLFEPILIDFEYVAQTNSEQEALDAMNLRLDEM